MKIIGRSGDRRILLEAHEDEIARIAGYPYVGEELPSVERMSDGWGYKYRFMLGAEIAVSPMWDWMKAAREQFEKITATGKLLQGVAEILANAPPPALVEPEEQP